MGDKFSIQRGRSDVFHVFASYLAGSRLNLKRAIVISATSLASAITVMKRYPIVRILVYCQVTGRPNTGQNLLKRDRARPIILIHPRHRFASYSTFRRRAVCFTRPPGFPIVAALGHHLEVFRPVVKLGGMDDLCVIWFK